jgi:hypothetical protein
VVVFLDPCDKKYQEQMRQGQENNPGKGLGGYKAEREK